MTDNERFPPVVELNVGGRHFTTSLLTLTKCKDTMLAAMFSGDYDVKKDHDGRYFIDADGDTFMYVLNYLRYGELPPSDMANTVYRDAVYFGLHGLVEQLERFPVILAKIQRDCFRNQFPGYNKVVTTIIDKLKCTNKKIADTTSNIIIVLFSRVKKPKLPNFDKGHVCFYQPKNKEDIKADVTLGPWSNKTHVKDVMNCIAFDLNEKGFVITHDTVGQCNYMCEKPADFPGRQLIENCCNSIFKLTFHWWKM